MRIVAEQEEVAERAVKQRMAPLLGGGTVARAYLTRVPYNSSSEPSVALCLVAHPPRDELLSEICAAFASMLARDQPVADVSVERGHDVDRICSPLFTATL